MRLLLKVRDTETSVGCDGIALTLFLDKQDALLDLVGSNLKLDDMIETRVWIQSLALSIGDKVEVTILDDTAPIDPPKCIRTEKRGRPKEESKNP